MVEGLGKDGEIDGGIVNGWGFDVAKTIFEIGELIFFGELLAEFDHLL